MENTFQKPKDHNNDEILKAVSMQSRMRQWYLLSLQFNHLLEELTNTIWPRNIYIYIYTQIMILIIYINHDFKKNNKTLIV